MNLGEDESRATVETRVLREMPLLEKFGTLSIAER
jgi:hypothetical protein